MTEYRIPIRVPNYPNVHTPIEDKIERRTRLFLMDGSSVDTPLTMYQLETFVQSAGRGQGTPFLRTMTIDKSGKLHSELISYGFLARVTDLVSYQGLS
jgi:hypothetical protein